MNAITPVGQTLSPRLAELVDGLVEPGPLGPRFVAPVDDATRQQAANAAQRLSAACQRAGVDVVRAWLKPVAASVRNPPSAAEFQARCELVAGLVPDVLIGALTPVTASEAVSTWQWWPAVADVAALLKPHADRLLAELRALRRIAEPCAEPDAPQMPSDAERAAVAAQMAEFRKQFASRRGSDGALAPDKPSYFADELLAVGYREYAKSADPNLAELARTRLAMMGAAASRAPVAAGAQR